MDVIAVVLSVGGAVLVVSGVFKLIDPGPARSMLQWMPGVVAAFPPRLLGTYEVVLGVGAVVIGGQQVALLVACTYVAFGTASLLVLRRGHAIACGCFGPRARPVSARHVVIDGALALSAGFAAWKQVDPLASTVDGIIDGVVTAMAVGGGTVAVVAALSASPGAIWPRIRRRSATEWSRAVESRPLVGRDLDGNEVTIRLGDRGQSTVLAFLSTGCGTCSLFWEGLSSARLAESMDRPADLVIVAGGLASQDLHVVRAVAPEGGTTIVSPAAWERFGVPGAPYFIVIDGLSQSVRAEGSARTWAQLATLVSSDPMGSVGVSERVDEELLPRSWLDERVELEGVPGRPGRLFAVEQIEVGETIIVLAGKHVNAATGAAYVSRHEGARDIHVDDEVHLLQAPDDPASSERHSCDPTTWLEGPFSLAARRRILPSEEITVDLATMIGDPDWNQVCRCGAPQCRGRVTGEDWKLPDVRARYDGHFMPLIATRIRAVAE